VNEQTITTSLLYTRRGAAAAAARRPIKRFSYSHFPWKALQGYTMSLADAGKYDLFLQRLIRHSLIFFGQHGWAISEIKAISP
jgi:hypothetical protein